MYGQVDAIAIVLAVLVIFSSAYESVPGNNDELEMPGFPDCVWTTTTTATTDKYDNELAPRADSRRGLRDTDDYDKDTPMELQCYQQGNSNKIKIGCVGDSITAGACSSGKSHTYPAVLQTLIGTDKYAVTNLGASGSTMLKSGNSPYWNRKQFKTLTNNTWDVLIVMLGTNDAKDKGSRGPDNWPHNCTGPNALSCPFAEDYLAMLELFQTLGPNQKHPPEIYVMIPPPLMKTGVYGMNATVINQVLPNLVPFIAKWAGLITDPIDIFGEFGGHTLPDDDLDGCSEATVNEAKCSWYCDVQHCDQCHPNDVGYYHMAKAVQKALGL